MSEIVDRLRTLLANPCWKSSLANVDIEPVADAILHIELLRTEWRRDLDELGRLRTQVEKTNTGLQAAIRAADLALFVIRKQDVMPNSSWQAGFERDMEIARASALPLR